MTACVFFILLTQAQVQTYTYDGLGNRIPQQATASSATGSVEKMQNINGRMVPLEATEVKVLRDDASGKLVERYVKRYDSNGNLARTDKIVEEQQKRPDGSVTTQKTVYRGDINGSQSFAERSVTETRRNGDVTTTKETVDRPTINGNVATVERRETVEQKTPAGQTINTSVFRRQDGGQMYEAAREITERKEGKNGAPTVENTTTYENKGLGGLKLYGQIVKQIEKAPDGTEQTKVDIYRRDAPGQTTEQDGKPKLIEEQVIARKKTGPGFVETMDVRRPTLSDPNRLGAPQRIGETVCKSACQ